ncbi:hypothetical protein VNO78_13355 [Psophocarpus tetragonolobus]|uniref:Uncharacterized protein n=1 Tax=Psophocarpus tetragonolobus TaxID=3891 RepID=A0AAN9SYU1_PSOTE
MRDHLFTLNGSVESEEIDCYIGPHHLQRRYLDGRAMSSRTSVVTPRTCNIDSSFQSQQCNRWKDWALIVHVAATALPNRNSKMLRFYPCVSNLVQSMLAHSILHLTSILHNLTCFWLHYLFIPTTVLNYLSV